MFLVANLASFPNCPPKCFCSQDHSMDAYQGKVSSCDGSPADRCPREAEGEVHLAGGRAVNGPSVLSCGGADSSAGWSGLGFQGSSG